MSATMNIDQKNSVPHFDIRPSKNNPRIQNILLSKPAIETFRSKVFAEWDLQAIEYKPFLRFVIADLLDEICDYQLAGSLNKILKDRDQGAFV